MEHIPENMRSVVSRLFEAVYSPKGAIQCRDVDQLVEWLNTEKKKKLVYQIGDIRHSITRSFRIVTLWKNINNSTANEDLFEILDILKSEKIDATLLAIAINTLESLVKILRVPPELTQKLPMLEKLLKEQAQNFKAADLSRIFYGLTRIGFKKIPPEVMERVEEVAETLNGTEVTNIIHSLPRLGISEIPPKLLRQLETVAPLLGIKKLNNILAVLAKLGFRDSPPEALKQRLTVLIPTVPPPELIFSLQVAVNYKNSDMRKMVLKAIVDTSSQIPPETLENIRRILLHYNLYCPPELKLT